MRLYFLLGIVFFSSSCLFAQSRSVTGKVTEAQTGVAVPFANVVISGTTIGTTTDFDGYYSITVPDGYDTISISYIGFLKKTKYVDATPVQIINIQLIEDVVNLEDVVIYAGENPAYPIMRNVVQAKEDHDKRNIPAYEYENYTKIEIAVDNIADRFKKRKVVQKITQVLDSIEVIAGEDGKPVLPIFISEALSTVYFRSNPQLKNETIKNTKITGVGVTDGTLTSQVIGGSFQEYNFYQNWLNIFGKEFISPIADGWKLYYEYELVDSLLVDDFECYRLDFWPKSVQDLAFQGTMWITKESYALKQIDVTVSPSANLNFIEKLKVQQELMPTEAGPWVPQKYRVVLDVGQLTDKTAGFLGKFYVSIKDLKVTAPRDLQFYQLPIILEENARTEDELFWETNRHDPLSSTEINVYQMIDTLKKIPVVKTYTDIAKTLSTGYYKTKYIDLGPYTALYGNNNIEGLRLGFGARTNIGFSDKWVLDYRVAYGFDDERWKHRASAEYIVSRKPWTTLKYEFQRDIQAIWLLNNGLNNNSLLYALSRFGNIQEPYHIRKNEFIFQSQLAKGLLQKIEFRNQVNNPLYDFRYFENPGSDTSPLGMDFTTTEVSIDTRFAKDELFVINDNERLSLGTIKWPVFNLRYTIGLRNALGGDFHYHKLEGRIAKEQKMGLLGVSDMELSGGYIFSQLPYPLLKNHIGNATNFYSDLVYNMMDFFEFTSDHWVSYRMRHHFEGFILNRVPLLRKLKWRLTGTANILFGGVRQDNLVVVPTSVDDQGKEVSPVQALDFTRPYVEVGYGIENIFKVFRIDAFHRLSYLDNDARRFGLKFSVQLIL